MTFRRILRAVALTVCAWLACSSLASHAQVYPVRPLKLVVPFAPGGAADGVARLLAERLSGMFQQQMTVENLPGRGGVAGTRAVAAAAPDGYTFLYVTDTTLITYPIFTERTSGYDPLASFEPVTLVSSVPAVLVVNPALPARDLAELVALLKASPGRYRSASDGWGTFPYRCAELFKSLTYVDIGDLPAKRMGDAVSSVVSGTASLMFDLPQFFEAGVREGKLRPLLVLGHSRRAALPGVPAAAEAGLPELTAYYWHGIVAPAKTPPDVVQIVSRAVNSVLAEIETQATFDRYRISAEGSTPEEFRRFILVELQKWSRAVPLSATAR